MGGLSVFFPFSLSVGKTAVRGLTGWPLALSTLSGRLTIESNTSSMGVVAVKVCVQSSSTRIRVSARMCVQLRVCVSVPVCVCWCVCVCRCVCVGVCV